MDGEQSKSGRRLRHRAMADTVEKVVKDNFKWYSAQDIDGTLVEGATLQQKLTEDKAAEHENPSSMPMGGPQLQEDQGSLAATLQVQDNNAEIQGALVVALMELKGV